MYRFSRIWGTITAGLGWLILVGTPVVVAVGATTQSQRVAQLTQVWRGATTPWLLANPALFVGAVALLGLLAGIVVGGAFIVVGQRLRIAVDSVTVQAAMLERLDEISAILAAPGRNASRAVPPLGGRVTNAETERRHEAGKAGGVSEMGEEPMRR